MGEGRDRESGLCFTSRAPALNRTSSNLPSGTAAPHVPWDTLYEARAPFRVVAETQRCRTGVRAFFLLQFNREGGATRLAKATRKSISPRFARSCSGTYLLTGNIRQVHIYPAR